MIGAGKRDTLVRFERNLVPVDDYGDEQPAGWVLVERGMAAVRYGTSAERRDAARNQAQQQVTLRVIATRKLREIGGKDRAVFGNRSWDISGPPAEIGRSELEFTATSAS